MTDAIGWKLNNSRRYLIMLILMVVDSIIVSTSPYLVLWMRFDGVVDQRVLELVLPLSVWLFTETKLWW